MANILIDSNGSLSGRGRKIARTSDGILHAIYTGSNDHVMYVYSDDNGQTWSSSEDISSTGATGMSIASDSQNNIHVVWADDASSNSQLHYRKKTGSGWQNEEQITNINGEQCGPCIAVDSEDNLHLAWKGYGLGTNSSYCNIYYRKKDTFGWKDIELVTDDGYDNDAGLDLAIDSDNNIHVVWAGEGYIWYSIYYRKKTSGGWQDKETIYAGSTSTLSDNQYPSICIGSDSKIHVTWGTTNYSTYFGEIKYSTKNGSWQTPTTLDQCSSFDHFKPTISVDTNNTIYVVYVFGDTSIGYLKVVKNTGSWDNPQNLINTSLNSFFSSCLWAGYPNSNITQSGFICIYQRESVYVFSSDDLSFGSLPPQPPTKPTGLLVNNQTNPSGIKDPNPKFSAIYHDPDNKNSTFCEIHVATSLNLLDNPDMWDSGWISDTTASGQRCSDKTYSGLSLNLEENVKYYWKIRFKDEDDLAGAWSDPSYFVTGNPEFIDKIFFRPYKTAKTSVRLTFSQINEILGKIEKIRNYADLYQRGFVIPHKTVETELRLLFHDLKDIYNKVNLPNFYTDFLSKENIIPYSTLLNKIRVLFHKDLDILLQFILPEYKDLYLKLIFNLYFTIASKIKFTPLADFITKYYQPNFTESLTKVKIGFPAYQTALAPSIDVWKDDSGKIYKEQILKVSYELYNYKTYMKFDLSGLNSFLSSWLTLAPTVSSWEKTNIAIYRIQQDWTEDDIPDNLSYDPYPVAIFSLGNERVNIDLTSLVQGWIKKVYPNCGILIKCTNNNYYVARTLGSSRHSLINYRPYLILYTPQEFTQKVLLVQSPPPQITSWKWQKTNNIYTISWQTPEDNRIIGFNVYHSTDLGSSWQKLNVDMLPATQRSFEVAEAGKYRASYNDFAVTSVIRYQDGTILESEKKKSKDIWGVRYILSWDAVEDAVEYRIYKGKL